MFPTQSNTKIGHRTFIAAAGLIGNEGRLVVLYSNSGVPTLRLPTALTDIPNFLLVDDGAPSIVTSDPGGQNCEGQPLDPLEDIRVFASGAGTAGTVLVMADPTADAGANAGTVIALPATAGRYAQVGVAEEDFVSGQLVLTRPALKGVLVTGVVAPPTALTSTQCATAAAVDLPTSEALANALKADYNALQADVAALLVTVSGLQAAGVRNGQITSS